MSFRLLKEEIIDVGLCQGCGLCAGSCKHIILVDGKPELVDFCITDKNGLKCGRCYDNCPQAHQIAVAEAKPLEVYSLRSNDEEILKSAASGGFVSTLNKHLLEDGVLSHIVDVKSNVEDRPESLVATDASQIPSHGGVVYGRSGVLAELSKLFGREYDNIGVVGVPCEIRGASYLEKNMGKEILKIGLFCNANIRSEATDSNNLISPCQHSCPAGVNASGYISLIREGKYKEAVDLIREANPLPSICGRVCTHECEYGCTLIGTNQPIAIRELKKFVTEWEMEHEHHHPTNPKPEGKKVAIIGAGPAGLTAAYYLAGLGYKVTIFEKTDKAGGMLRYGVPKFRLPDSTLDYDIETILEMGVEIKYNTSIGKDLTFPQIKAMGYEALLISIGQWLPRTLKLDGEDLPEVYTAIEFLTARKYRYWDNVDEFKDKVVGILGAGPVGVDAAQTALRLGAKHIHMVDIASEESLHIAIEEVPEAERKYLTYHFDTSTINFTQNETGNIVFNCKKVQTGTFNAIDGSDFKIDVDAIVIAVGQAVDYAIIEQACEKDLSHERGKLVVDEITFATNQLGIFAAGDIVNRGKNVAIAAISHGKNAALSIDHFLRGVDINDERKLREQHFFQGPLSAPKDTSPKAPLEASTDEIFKNWDTIDGVFDLDQALGEAKRCLSCNKFCTYCQDFAGVFADITAGEVGSEKGYTTVLAWTEKGKALIEDLIAKGLVSKGEVDLDKVQSSIEKKKERNIAEHPRTLREQIYNSIVNEGLNTISALAKKYADVPSKDIRFNALRLAQEKKVGYVVDDGAEEPYFTAEVEE